MDRYIFIRYFKRVCVNEINVGINIYEKGK